MSAPTILRPDQTGRDAQQFVVGPDTLPGGHQYLDAQAADAAGTPSASSRRRFDAQSSRAAGALPPAANGSGPPKVVSPRGTDREGGSAASLAPSPIQEALADPFLALAADVLDDTERTRIANQNRLRQLTRTATDKDGEERGFGLDESHPDVARLAALVDALGRIEHDAALNLCRLMRRHPLGPWCKAPERRGVGDRQAARLLAAIGDPYWHTAENRPRTVSELWAYCGYRPGQKRQKGVKSNWSSAAKMRAYLIAESCMKQPKGTPYREVYDARRKHTALTRPDWPKGHSHNDALRVVAKAVLRDLWREAKRLHESPTP